MMRFNVLVGSVLLATASSLGVISSALAIPVSTIVNVDLEGYRTGGGGTDTGVPPTTYVGVGAAGGGTVFNGLSPTALSDNTASPVTGDNQTYTAAALLNSTGTATPVGFTIGPIGVDNENTNVGVPTDPQALFNDYMFNHSAGQQSNATFTISGLTGGATYDIYLYAGFANAAFLGNTTITGGTSTPFVPTGIYSAGNTVLWVAAADGSGNISGTMGAGTNILAGVTVASTPEPASLSLLGFGALGLLVRRRRA